MPFTENTTVFAKGSCANGDPAGGLPIALTTCTSPGCIVGDLEISTSPSKYSILLLSISFTHANTSPSPSHRCTSATPTSVYAPGIGMRAWFLSTLRTWLIANSSMRS